ncbi:hypothetical protein [Delftia phage PhiW-14]|uniref:Uncharacterized protein n=1 Tax=Delftia phage PhiW-14 TaxID=665032 RepID=C9DGI1_BPW14|nr:hypothetical protein DP-phiW-14_gp211 [Delftia phage PhiW-14]ACV50232.1 hypothetical protein [Delftia phage PhiW-14]
MPLLHTEAQKAELAALRLAVQTAQSALGKANVDLEHWLEDAKNNEYDSLDEAECEIEDALIAIARADCEGSHNVGLESYEQHFIVGGQLYKGVLYCEYNRHDKEYYYLDSRRFQSFPVVD